MLFTGHNLHLAQRRHRRSRGRRPRTVDLWAFGSVPRSLWCHTAPQIRPLLPAKNRQVNRGEISDHDQSKRSGTVPNWHIQFLDKFGMLLLRSQYSILWRTSSFGMKHVLAVDTICILCMVFHVFRIYICARKTLTAIWGNFLLCKSTGMRLFYSTTW